MTKLPAIMTDEQWPRHPDGRRKKIGEMTHAEADAVTRGAIERLKPEMASIGIALRFGGTIIERGKK